MQMEVCSHLSFPVTDSKTLHGFHMNTLVGNFPMDELSYKTTKFLNIQDDIKGVSDNLHKPVSAMKGSREKRGLRPAKQLTVKWAPDVYDPVVPCSTVVIVVKRPRKKNGGQPKSSHGGKSKSKGKGKEKKQSRKRGGEVL